jgi:hypothetical protein
MLVDACTSTREIGFERSQTSPEEMVRSVSGEEVMVVIEDSAQHEGEAIGVDRDTLRLLLKDSGKLLHLPMQNVKSIKGGGSLLGPAAELPAGGVVGGFVGAGIGRAGSSSFRSIGEGLGALSGAAFGAIIGVAIGAMATPAVDFVLPDSRIEPTGSRDVGTVRVDRLLEETDVSVTIRWYDGTATLPKSQITIERRADGIYVKAPKPLLYDERGRRGHISGAPWHGTSGSRVRVPLIIWKFRDIFL